MNNFENPFASLQEERKTSALETNSENTLAENIIDRSILVDGSIRGIERSQLSLHEFSKAPSFKQCFFETESGNLYGIFKQHPDLILADARSNAGKGSKGGGTLLSDDSGILQVGQSFHFGRGNTSVVTQIVIVTDAHFLSTNPDVTEADQVAAQETEGRQSDIRRRFHEILHAKS